MHDQHLQSDSALGKFIGDNIPGASFQLKIERIAGGQSNPTFLVESGCKRMVLRKQPGGALLPSAHAIDREYRIMQALAASEVPVPKMISYLADSSIVGTPAYLMEYVDGRVFHTATIEGVEPEARAAMFKSAAEVLGRLHRVDWTKSGLSDFGKPGNYFQRQISRWTRQWNTSKEEIPDVDRLGAWLAAHIPSDDRTTICHGDYRIGNLLFHPRNPHIAAVLDWELSTLGHPLADLAHFCIPFHTLPEEYGGIAGLDHPALGIPSEEEIVRHYSVAAGKPAMLLPFHLGFALFRFAVIFAGIKARAAAGNAADPSAASIGNLVGSFARRGCELLGI
jgi:aminoglycoside phosphotransferase (APT) family kinase protein